MATSSTKKTAKPEGEAAPIKKTRAVKSTAAKDPAEKSAPKKSPAKEKVKKLESSYLSPIVFLVIWKVGGIQILFIKQRMACEQNM